MNKPIFMIFDKSIWDEQEGVTSIEYALMGSLIAAVIVGAAGVLGTNNAALFTLVANCVTFVTTGTGSCA